MALNDHKIMERAKQAFIKHRAKLYTDAIYFALSIGREKY